MSWQRVQSRALQYFLSPQHNQYIRSATTPWLDLNHCSSSSTFIFDHSTSPKNILRFSWRPFIEPYQALSNDCNHGPHLDVFPSNYAMPFPTTPTTAPMCFSLLKTCACLAVHRVSFFKCAPILSPSSSSDLRVLLATQNHGSISLSSRLNSSEFSQTTWCEKNQQCTIIQTWHLLL